MAELRFFFGTMGSGKSTQALQIHHNLTQRGLGTLLLSQLDRQAGRVSSRLGVSAEATIVEPGMDLQRFITAQHAATPLHAVVCDEAQFYQSAQIDQLARAVDELDIEVYAFGLLTTFQGCLFPATKRLLELADVRSELQVEARCFCGARATHNARLLNGQQVYDGDLVALGDTEAGSGNGDQPSGPVEQQVITYDLRCRRHWMAGLANQPQTPLFDPADTDGLVLDLRG